VGLIVKELREAYEFSGIERLTASEKGVNVEKEA